MEAPGPNGPPAQTGVPAGDGSSGSSSSSADFAAAAAASPAAAAPPAAAQLPPAESDAGLKRKADEALEPRYARLPVLAASKHIVGILRHPAGLLLVPRSDFCKICPLQRRRSSREAPRP